MAGGCAPSPATTRGMGRVRARSSARSTSTRSTRATGVSRREGGSVRVRRGPRPQTASKVWDLSVRVERRRVARRSRADRALDAPVSIYECTGRGCGCRRRETAALVHELAEKLTAYVRDGRVHARRAAADHRASFDGSWGYKTVGYFAPTGPSGRAGLHAPRRCAPSRRIGVILDWVPAHFPATSTARTSTARTLRALDARQGAPGLGQLIFNYGRNEVTNFLLASASSGSIATHRRSPIDAVARCSTRLLRSPEWIPNQFGGRELRQSPFSRLNERVHGSMPSVTIAENDGVAMSRDRRTRRPRLRLQVGWAGCTTCSTTVRPRYTRYHHDRSRSHDLRLAGNFVLPLSHDEVVHGKRSARQDAGDGWGSSRTSAPARHDVGQPGRSFSGWDEIAQGVVGQTQRRLALARYPQHAGVRRLVAI